MGKTAWLAAGLIMIIGLLAGGCAPSAEATAPTEEPRYFPEGLRWLTEEEQSNLLETALATAATQELLETGLEYQTGIRWLALTPNPEGEGYAGYSGFEYEIVAVGIPVSVPDDADLYPGVIIWFGMPAEYIVSVAIDPETWQVVYEASYPDRGTPE